jgi:Family of unknown function (DUF6459)
MSASRPTMPGELRPPAPQAAAPTRGHEPPAPRDTGASPKPRLPAEQALEQPGCPKAPGGRRPLPDPVAAPDPVALPDPVAVWLCRIPDPAPPYDGEATQGTGIEAAQGTGIEAAQGTGIEAAQGRGVAAAARHGETPDAPEGQARRAARQAGTTPATPPAWPSRFAQVLAETLAGTRPPGQIVPWTTEMARAHIQRLGPQLASGLQPRVRHVVTYHPTSDVMEMAVVVGFGTRVRALAVRLERADLHPAVYTRRAQAPGWLCTAVEAA